jgi:flavin-dependent dehydrogenase
VIAEQGRQAAIYEKHDDVGHRFHGDFQGLENWTTNQDVLEEFVSLGIKTNFDHLPIHELTIYGPGGTQRTVSSQQPLLYIISRGPQTGSLDYALKQQVQQCGAEIRFSQTIDAMPNGGIVTHGPHRADVIAVGYLFETDMPDGLYMAVADELAPKGYAYLVIWNGRGTIASCMFDDFHQEKQYLERTVEFFTDKTGLQMQSPSHFGGTGNFQIPETAHKGDILYAGESAGFQDPLFGFGIRSSILTGVAAAQALVRIDPHTYETFWKARIRDIQRTGMVNRGFYERLGNKGYTRLIRNFPKDGDIRQRMFNEYRPKLWKSLWYQLIKRNKKRLFCITPGCECTWCRCARCVPEGGLP